MRNIVKILFAVLFLNNHIHVFAQVSTVHFERISLEQGLSQSSVYAILKDSKGFLWFGTAEGLNRFDGSRFVHYKKDLNNHSSISDSWVTCIFEDTYSNLWIGTHSGGLNLYNYADQSFSHFTFNIDDNTTISNNTINAICEDKDGFLWIATDNGLNNLNLKKFQQKKDSKPIFKRINQTEVNNLPSNEIISLCVTTDNQLWIGTYGGGFARMLKSKDGTEVFYIHRNTLYTSGSDCDKNIWSIIQDTENQNILWILNSCNLVQFNKNTRQFIRLYEYGKTMPRDLRMMTADKQGNLWIGTRDNGLLKFEKSTGIFSLYRNSIFEYTSLSKNNILSIYADNEGIIWVGTKGGGLNKKTTKQFTHYKSLAGIKGSLNANSVWALYKDRNGTIWAGTEQGLNKLNQSREYFTDYVHDKAQPNSISDNSVYCIFEDREGDFWIGTSSGGLNYMDRKTGKFRNYRHIPGNPNSLSFDYVRDIAQDEDGFLWIATRGGGLNRFDKTKGTFKHFKHHPDKPGSLSADRLNALHIDKYGYLWIATTGGGLNRFDLKTETIKRYHHNPSDSTGINDVDIMAFCEEKSGNLWVGTYNGGINILNRKTGTFKHITENDGLPNNLIYGILADRSGNIWVSTNNGLSKIDPISLKFDNYDVSDGLQDNEFNSAACFVGQDGEMLFGGINGFNVFIPENIIKNTVIPTIVLTEIKIINNKTGTEGRLPQTKSLINSKEITLTSKDYFFSIEFAALSFISPGKNKYAYILEGFDKEWITTTAQNKIATYTNLEGGTYIFRVKASNNDGVWNNEGISLKIIIKPPFWKTQWFKFVLILLLVLGIYLIYRIRIRSLQKQKKRLEQTVHEKTKEVVEQKNQLQKVNQELLVSNYELNNQREGLEKTLETLKSTQLQLIQSEKMASLGILSAGVAHEINNPLNFIQGGIDGLELYINQNLNEHTESVSTWIKGIKLGVSRVSTIVKSLNHYCLTDEYKKVPCNINEIIDNCVIMLQGHIKDRIHLEKQVDENIESILGNESKLHQAILNILINAAQAIEKEGNIHISGKQSGNFVLIEITDNGSGISSENLPKIFDPFFTTKDPGKGTGLGLSIAHSIINDHLGELQINSEKGKGTVVSIKLPYNKAS
jgi:ligand-binding sensor domain-containing protein/signal transduction histidine kinase